MQELQETIGDILPPNPIRVETALSRYPVHRLAKHGDIAIDIREKNASGEISIKWEVMHSPGPLAYKLDTLIINRRIEEVPRPIPRIIRLGSLRDICRELGHSEGENVNTVRKALRQNAFAGITARIRYRQNDGSERTLEADFTRYSVVFTGENLPDGRTADAVYIVLNDIYMQVINGAMTRPLDYDYLKSLPPAPQRFYELLSYQMYAAIKNDRARAKLVYSEFCTYAPQTRYPSFDQLKKQMYKIHTHHRESGYIAKIDYEQTVDGDGNPDWIMLYQPGPKARAEYKAFSKRGGPVMLEVEPFPAAPPFSGGRLPLDRTIQNPPVESEPSPLEAELIGYRITDTMARQLVADHGEEKIRSQIEILEWYKASKPGKIDDEAAWLVSAIKSRNGRSAPKGFISRAERERQAEATRQRQQAEADARRREREEQARQQEEERAADAYWAALTPERQRQLEADALADGGEAARNTYETMRRINQGKAGDGYLKLLRRDYIVRLMQEGKLTPTEA